jgi:hypothetical protein
MAAIGVYKNKRIGISQQVLLRKSSTRKNWFITPTVMDSRLKQTLLKQK